MNIERLVFTKEDIAIKFISSSDKRLGALINCIGDLELELRDDHFSSLIRAILGQQLSLNVARAIWERLCKACNTITPGVLLSAEENVLKKAGLSNAKIKYIKTLSSMVSNGELKLNNISLLDDESAINSLTKVPGLGRWTAEMFLIFSLGRIDVLPVNDAGIRRAIKTYYSLDNMPKPNEIELIGEKWKPFRSVATLYLWEALNKCINPGDI